ncbi:MFS transporter [Bifidobacterium breve]|nr:MFS transporter [Bifidobacterium breve]MCZ4453488.1 MFS transporter [Bifidobacterium breve]
MAGGESGAALKDAHGVFWVGVAHVVRESVRDFYTDCVLSDQPAKQAMAREMLGVICNPLTSTLWCGLGQRNITVAADGKWFVADSCTSLSSSIQGFALPLIAQTVTGSPAQATLLDSIMTLISSVLRLPGGVVQDKYDREKLMIAFGLIGFALFGICAALGWAGLLIYPVLMVLAICLGMGMIETIAAPAITFLSGIAMQHWGYSVTSVALGLCIVAVTGSRQAGTSKRTMRRVTSSTSPWPFSSMLLAPAWKSNSSTK